MDEKVQKSLETVRDAGLIATVGATYQNLSDFGLEQTQLGLGARAAIQGVAGLALCAGVGATGAPSWLAVGLGVGGIMSGVRTLVQAVRVQMLLNQMGAANPTQAPAANTNVGQGTAQAASPGAGQPAPGAAPAARVLYDGNGSYYSTYQQAQQPVVSNFGR